MTGPEAISIESITAEYRKLGRSVVVTHGGFSLETDCSAADLEWNHMDQGHRPWIHKTYVDSVRTSAAPDFQISLTQIRFLGIRFFVQVSDLRLGNGIFYQVYNLLNLFQIHAVVRCEPRRQKGEWSIVSHWLLKPLHGLISRHIRRLNLHQNAADEPIRKERTRLRKLGYRFEPEERDFISANLRTNQTQFPPLGSEQRIDVAGLRSGEMNRVKAGPVDFLVLPMTGTEAGSFRVWTAACPHEGGPLADGELCEGARSLRCGWHGFKFSGALISERDPVASFAGFSFRLDARARQLIVSSC